MKSIFLSLLAASLFVGTLSAAAANTVDERIYICTADADAKYLGPGEKYRVHETKGESIKITRLSDKKWLRGVWDGAYNYIFGNGAEGGNLWADRYRGYSGQVYREMRLIVSRKIGQGRYEGESLEQCQLARIVRQPDPLAPTETQMIAIGEEANLANGGWRTDKFDTSTFSLEDEKAALVRYGSGWEGCKWKTYRGEDALRTIGREADDPEALRKIRELLKDAGLFEAIAYVSGDEIECSQRYVWIYTKNGYKFQLNYSQGD